MLKKSEPTLSHRMGKLRSETSSEADGFVFACKTVLFLSVAALVAAILHGVLE